MMKQERVKIDGMGCSHCVDAVESALKEIGVDVYEVSIGTADIRYDESRVGRSQIDSAISAAGYRPSAHVDVENLSS